MYHIREATAKDTGALAALSGQLGYPADAGSIARRLDAIARHAAGVVLVAESGDGRVLGFAHALPQQFIIADSFVDLAGLVVGDPERGAGIGAALLAAVEAWTRAHGFASVQVRSNVIRERAHRFYLREGYTEEKRQKIFVKRL